MRENRLLSAALICVTTLYTIVGGTAVTDTTKAGAGTVAGAAGIHGVPTGRVVPGVRPAAAASLRDVARSAAQHDFTFPTTEMPKAAEAKTSKSKNGFMVPPPPPTPCVLPPAFAFFPMQPAQQDAEPQQQLQQAQAQSSDNAHNQSAARENAPQQSDQELQAADQELQEALRSSLRTVGEWKR
jgi:hypothetical protein